MTPQDISQATMKLCRIAPVIPVLVLDDPAKSAPLAQALVSGGLPALEVTLRTPAALDCIREMAKIPGGIPGAGTVLTPADVQAAKDAAGAVSDALIDADLTLARGRLIYLAFDRALAKLEGTGTQRRIDLRFRARVEDN